MEDINELDQIEPSSLQEVLLNYVSCLWFFSKQTAIEIEQLNARVVEAETKLKTEVQRIKKKLQIQITELEMSLDVANRNNIELQKTIKKQSLQLTVSCHLFFIRWGWDVKAVFVGLLEV